MSTTASPTTLRVMRDQTPAPAGTRRCGRFSWRAADDGIEVFHDLDDSSISDSTMIDGLTPLVLSGVLRGQDAFEQAAVGVIETSARRPADGWAAFYDNSVAELTGGSSPFSPIHRRARSLVAGDSVLEVGCCFGFLALQLADDGHDVSACDITPGAIDHLRTQARRRGVAVQAVVGDATDLPFADESADTVTLIHLIEHLDERDAVAAIAQALRVARRRVVVAVPFEDEPTEHYGHLVRLTTDDLHRWASQVDHAGAEVFTDHGGWLVLTPV